MLSLCAPLEKSLKAIIHRMSCMLSKFTAEVAGDPHGAEMASLLWREAGEVVFPHVCSSLAFVFGQSGGGMEQRLKIGLADSFAQNGFALSWLKRTFSTEAQITEAQKHANPPVTIVCSSLLA